jgi:hypothetical protein
MEDNITNIDITEENKEELEELYGSMEVEDEVSE